MTPALATDGQIAKILPAAYQRTAHIDVTALQPMSGRVIIRDEHDDSQVNGIAIPENVVRQERNRIGLVVAVGEGDRWIELEQRGAYGCLRLKSFHGAARRPMQTKPGDRVIYNRRRECEIEIAGARYQLCYEEQSVLAVLED